MTRRKSCKGRTFAEAHALTDSAVDWILLLCIVGLIGGVIGFIWGVPYSGRFALSCLFIIVADLAVYNLFKATHDNYHQ